jgi:hypothetical protein
MSTTGDSRHDASAGELHAAGTEALGLFGRMARNDDHRSALFLRYERPLE